MSKVIIVGGGISGQALAYRLQQLAPSADIKLLEQASRPGGTIWTEQHDGFQFELGPNGFLDTKPTTVALCRELGLGDRLVPASEAASRNRYLFLDGKLKPLPGSFKDFLRTDLLSWRGKLSFFAERFRPRRHVSADESIDAFARRRAGREAAKVFADGLVTGIHAGDPTLLSVRATFPRLVALAARTGAMIVFGEKAGATFPHRAVRHGEEITIGNVVLKLIATPGHTPEGICVLVTDPQVSLQPQKVLTGDTLFIGDVGRPDLAGGKGYTPQMMAAMLYDSLHEKLLRLPDHVEVYPAHGAGSMCGRNMSNDTTSTIGEQRKFNYALRQMTKDEFVAMMTADLPEAPAYFPRDAEINRSGVARSSPGGLVPLRSAVQGHRSPPGTPPWSSRHIRCQ